jgi:acyl-CoA dehydrogenase
MDATPLIRAAPDPAPIEAFLDAPHLAMAERLPSLMVELDALPEAPDDAAARRQAREILMLLGRAGWYAAIEARDFRSCCLIREALGAASPLADAVFALQALGSMPLILGGDPGHLDQWVRPAIRGEAMAAFAMTEPDAGSDVAALATTAVRDGDRYVLDGRKTFISNAGIADFYAVFATLDRDRGTRGITCFVVPADTPGLDFVGAQVMSAPHPLGELALTDCRVPAASLVGGEGEGFKIGMATLDRLRPTVGAAACGMAARALEEALAHAGTRHQFGQPLADFQIIQEKLGRMYTDLVASRLLVYQAAWRKDRGAHRITLEAAVAKAFSTEAAQTVVDQAVQIVGGRGVLADHPVDRLYRSVRALRVYEGTTEIQRMIIARRLVEARKRPETE